jgi:hypothetical protein
MGEMILKILLSCGCLLRAAFRIIYPKATVDFWLLGLLAGVTVPWYAGWLLRKLPFDLGDLEITNSGFKVVIEGRKAAPPERQEPIPDKPAVAPAITPKRDSADSIAVDALAELHRLGDSLDMARTVGADALVDLVVRMCDLVQHLACDEVPRDCSARDRAAGVSSPISGFISGPTLPSAVS